MLERIWAVQDMMAAATPEIRYEPYDFFTIPENDEIKGVPLPQARAVTDPQSYTPMDNNGNRLPDLPTVPNPNNDTAHHRNPQPASPPSTAVTDSPGTLWPGQSVPAGAPGTPEYTPGKPNPVPPQPNPQPPVEPTQGRPLDRVDPALLNTVPGLSGAYNSDGTLKTPQQQGTERTAQDLVDVPKALVDNRTGITGLGGGGRVEKTITATTDGWQVDYNLTLANGYTSTTSKTGVDIEQLDNGRTATTLSYQDAARQARTELGRIQQQMLTPDQNQPDNTIVNNPSVFSSGITDAGDARQLVEALERLTANPHAPIRIVKDATGRITTLTVLSADGREHVLVLNAGGVSYDQENKKYFEFYRQPDGVIRTSDGYRIVDIDGQFIRLDDSGAPVIPTNPTADEARVFDSNGVRTSAPHGASLLPGNTGPSTPDYGPSPSTPPTTPNNDGPLRYPVTPNPSGPFVVELPNGDLAPISEIQIPKGVSAHRMYKVDGGGLLVENQTGLHWATDPGRPPTPEETGKAITNAVAETIIWTAAGEGLGYIAIRTGAKVLPKITDILTRNTGRTADTAITSAGTTTMRAEVRAAQPGTRGAESKAAVGSHDEIDYESTASVEEGVNRVRQPSEVTAETELSDRSARFHGTGPENPGQDPVGQRHQPPKGAQSSQGVGNASTGEQVEAYLSNRYGLPVVGFTDPDLPVEPLAEFARAIDDIVARYPDIELPRFVGVADEGPGSIEYAVTTGIEQPDGTWVAQALTLNREWVASLERMRIVTHENVATGYHPPGLERRPWYATTVHELGHVLDIQGNYHASNAATRALKTYFKRHVPHSSDPVRASEEFEAWVSALSGYSFEEGEDLMLNEAEAVAEAFADVELNGANASEPAKVLHQLLIESRRHR